MTSIELPDPAGFGDRACRGVSQDVFFPEGPACARHKQIQRAQAYCLSCPRMVACAAWAAPIVAAGELADCVIASVYVPTARSCEESRTAALRTLVTIAASLLPENREVA